MSSVTNFLLKGVEQIIRDAHSSKKKQSKAVELARTETKYQATKLGLSDAEKQHIPSEAKIQELIEKYYAGGVVGTSSTGKVVDRRWFLDASIIGDLTEKEIVWTVKNVIMAAVLNLFVGDPDVGKSFMACVYIAALSREGKNCLVICKEDDYSNVWKPRLRAAGADLKFVRGVNHVGDLDDPTIKEDWALDLPHHREALKQCISLIDAALTVIDPLDSFSGTKDLNRRKDCRDLLDPLNEIAQSTGKGILINCHTTKALVDSVIRAAAGNFQIMAAVQVAWFLLVDPDKPDRRLFMCARNKLGAPLSGQRYTIRDFSETDKTGVIEFKGAEYRNVNGILKQMTGRTQEDSKSAKCRKWLLEMLDGGPQPTELCNKAANAFGFDKNTLNDACAQLKVIRDGNTWRIEPKEAEQQPTFDDYTQNRGEPWNC
ncbi:MAG: AAA family ATPase [Candidatus Sulfotelmatobacter sp.]